MNDLWYSGYACGTRQLDWLRTVAGRLLRSYERAALAAGWKEGLAGAVTYHADMARDPYAVPCGDAIPY